MWHASQPFEHCIREISRIRGERQREGGFPEIFFSSCTIWLLMHSDSGNLVNISFFLNFPIFTLVNAIHNINLKQYKQMKAAAYLTFMSLFQLANCST